MTGPRTEAGRALLAIVRQQATNRERLTADGVLKLILAIEDEARGDQDARAWPFEPPGEPAP